MSRLVLALGLLGAVLYLSLEYVLVLGAGPVPALGAVGSGAAHLATRIVIAVALVFVAYRILGIRFRPGVVVRRLGLARRMAGLALPSVSAYLAYGLFQIVLLGMIASEGQIAVLSRAYVLIAMAFLTLVIMAVSQGTEVLIGYRLGAGDHEAVQRQGMKSAWIAAGLSMGCAIVIYFASGPFLGLFTTDPEVHETGRRLLWLTIVLQPFFAFNMILLHALRAVEDVRWPVLVNQLVSWGVGLPLAWVLCVPVGLGVEGVWIALIVDEMVKALAMVLRWQWRIRLPALVERAAS